MITPSSAHNSPTSTDTVNRKKSATPPGDHQQIYSILCQLRDTICAETLKTLSTNEKNDDDNSHTTSAITSSTLKNDTTSISSHHHQQQHALNELLFLQTEVREPRLPPSSSGEVPISQTSHKDVSRTRSNESVQHSSSTSHGISSTPVYNRHSQHHGQRTAGGTGAIARQVSRDSQHQSHDLSEMEEDEGSERPQVLVQPPRPRRGRHVRV